MCPILADPLREILPWKIPRLIPRQGPEIDMVRHDDLPQGLRKMSPILADYLNKILPARNPNHIFRRDSEIGIVRPAP
jgi:hypothetical protein